MPAKDPSHNLVKTTTHANNNVINFSLTTCLALLMTSQTTAQPQTQTPTPGGLDMRDTITPSDLLRFTTFVQKEKDPNTYLGYTLNDAGKVEFTVYDGDTDEIVERQEFGDNGRAREYVEQTERLFEEAKASGLWVAPKKGEGEGDGEESGR